MININVKKEHKGNLDAALKKLKNKFTSQKTVEILREKKHFTKKSVKKRMSKKKAVYVQKMKSLDS